MVIFLFTISLYLLLYCKSFLQITSIMDLLNGSSNLTRNINDLYASRSFSDVTLVVNKTRRFKAHRAILAGQSPYFKALLFGNLGQSSRNEIELKVISVKAFEAVLKYLYAVPLSFDAFMKDGEVNILMKLSISINIKTMLLFCKNMLIF